MRDAGLMIAMALVGCLAGCTTLADPNEVCCGADGGPGVDGGEGPPDAGPDSGGDAGRTDDDAGPPTGDAGPLDGGGGADGGARAIATLVTAGVDHSCAALSDGRIACWGSDASGQITGAGGATARLGPTLAPWPAGSPVLALCAGDRFTCAARAGVTRCWGANDRGQLGDGGTSGNDVQGLGADNVVELACGMGHACARSASSSVYCWGANGRGQVGSGDGNDARVAYELPTIRAGRIAAGGLHTCAAESDNVVCWGDNTSEQICAHGGSGCSNVISSPRVVVRAAAVHLAAGAGFTCVTESGSARCLPDGGSVDDILAMFTPPLGELTGAGVSLCAVDATGNVRCGGSLTDPTIPDPVQVRRLDVGRSHACGIAAETGAVYCWGTNDDAQVTFPRSFGVQLPGTLVPLDGI